MFLKEEMALLEENLAHSVRSEVEYRQAILSLLRYY